MAKRDFPRANYLTEEINQRLYALGENKLDEKTLLNILLECGKVNFHNEPDVAPKPLDDAQAQDFVKQFFSSFSSNEIEGKVKIFMLQYTRMELFQTVRYLWGKCGDEIPVDQIYKHIPGAAGKYQGGKIIKHLIPHKHMTQPVQISSLSEFFFQFEAMLKQKAVEGGELAELDLDAELVAAVKDGATDQLRMLLASPLAKPDAVMVDNKPLVNAAFDMGNAELLKVVLQGKADPNVKNSDGNTCLIRALEDPEIEIIQTLLSAKADVTAVRDDGSPVLHVAMSSGDENSVHMLLKHGADWKQKDGDDKDAVEFAKDLELDEELIQALQVDRSQDTAAAEEEAKSEEEAQAE
mmetsp:Transcript_18283/g.35778  ORF Transcript_18283/g.35778 Transcript_18283/m.35778 type:complete len:352 (-) Transcript_18283:33-1088(-)